jgi:cytochrome c-type biogenesis protein CcmH
VIAARVKAAVLAALAAGLLCMAGTADDPAQRLPNPAQEARARHLFTELRCVVCQNESIDDSPAEIAGDLRQIVRAQIVAGRTDQQVIDYMVQRYGEFILLKPTLTPGNLALWLTPFLADRLHGAALRRVHPAEADPHPREPRPVAHPVPGGAAGRRLSLDQIASAGR